MLRGVSVMPAFIGSLPQNCWETAPVGAWQGWVSSGSRLEGILAECRMQHVFFKTTANVGLLLWSLVGALPFRFFLQHRGSLLNKEDNRKAEAEATGDRPTVGFRPAMA